MTSSHDLLSSRRRRGLRGATIVLVLVSSVVAATGSSSATTNASPPSNVKRPSVSGKALDGRTLAVNRGTWTNSPTAYAYQWLHCDTAAANCGSISGANSDHYTLVSGDVGHTIRVQVTAKNSAGSGNAESDPTAVVQAVGSAPANQTKPSISGSTQLGSTLTVTPGRWSGTQPISITEQWQRCDGNANNCADISGATGTSYNVAQSDVGNTLRIKEIARNAKGTNAVASSATSMVTPARGGTISVTLVGPPERLVVDKVQFAPSPLRSRRTLIARFHVSDTRGFAVQGALVYALGLPYGWVRNAGEVPTDASGWATIVLQPTRALPLHRGQALVVFVRARKPGDNLLAGVSTRRLVQASLG